MKKEKDDAAKAAEKAAAQRASIIADYNTNNMGETWIDPNRVPTEDDIKSAEEDLKKAQQELQERTYLIADADNAKRIAEFLKSFIANGFWTQRFFVGVINFNTYIEEFLTAYEKEPKELRMDYGPMQFCFLMLENYAGFGIESALKMHEMWDEYVAVYDLFRDHIESYKEKYGKIQKLNERYNMMTQGFYMVILTPDESFEKASNMTITKKSECDACDSDECCDKCMAEETVESVEAVEVAEPVEAVEVAEPVEAVEVAEVSAPEA